MICACVTGRKRISGKSSRIAMIVARLIAGVIAAVDSARLIAPHLYGITAAGPRWSLARYEYVDSANARSCVEVLRTQFLTALEIFGRLGRTYAHGSGLCRNFAFGSQFRLRAEKDYLSDPARVQWAHRRLMRCRTSIPNSLPR